MFKPGDEITRIRNRVESGGNLIRVLKIQLANGQVIAALGADDN